MEGRLPPKSANLVESPSSVSRAARRALLGHGAVTLWFTGLSGSGKSTICRAVERRLIERGALAYVLDGDNVRGGLCADLGFAPHERAENIRRIAELARLFNDAGVIALTAFISPYRSDRARARAILPADEFVEVFVDAPLAVCEARDVKGLYRRARAGEIEDFTGVTAPYEPPEQPELRLASAVDDVERCAQQVVDYLERRGVLASLKQAGRGPIHAPQ
jgi:adenylylsulfate kinase